MPNDETWDKMEECLRDMVPAGLGDDPQYLATGKGQIITAALAALGTLREDFAAKEQAWVAKEKDLILWLNCGGPPTGKRCAVDGHLIYGGFVTRGGIDDDPMCELHAYREQIAALTRERDEAARLKDKFEAALACCNATAKRRGARVAQLEGALRAIARGEGMDMMKPKWVPKAMQEIARAALSPATAEPPKPASCPHLPDAICANCEVVLVEYETKMREETIPAIVEAMHRRAENAASYGQCPLSPSEAISQARGILKRAEAERSAVADRDAGILSPSERAEVIAASLPWRCACGWSPSCGASGGLLAVHPEPSSPTWGELNRERGVLVDKNIANTISVAESVRLLRLTRLAEAYLAVVAPRDCAVLEEMEARLTQEPAVHAYTSTACYHGLHDRCRRECKFCGVACACPCGHPPVGWLYQGDRSDVPSSSAIKCGNCGHEI